ncbi:MAG: ABC transporter substrate-binding protein [Pseudomonadota bacterium]
MKQTKLRISKTLAFGASVAVIGSVMSAGSASAQDCPAVTVTDNGGLSGAYPQQFDLPEFEGLANCTLTFSENPDITSLNAQITGNPDLPSVADRVPAEALVVAPYNEIGQYGGVLNGLSNATEAGTSDLLSVRHVNLVRYADDLQTIVPNVARSWDWNDDYTELTFHLRDGHLWSDGQPFTANDVVFWYEALILNDNIYPETPSRWLFEGNPMQVEAIDDTTVRMTFPAPAPGILNRFAVDYGQPFQPEHFLGQFHIDYNPDADSVATEAGFDGWADMVNAYYGGSDWKDVPSPLLSGSAENVVPTLESHILVEESATGRHLVANPYFHMVDTAGNQLPYISEIDEQYIPDAQVRNLMITSGDVDYKAQSVFIDDFPLYVDNEEGGNYTVHLSSGLGNNVFYAFNVTHPDETLREIFSDVRFRQAMSLALNRDEMNELVFLGQGTAAQSTPAEPATVAFISDDMLNSYIDYDPDAANALLDDMGLTDQTGDGLRDLANGDPLVVRINYSNQGAPVRLHELAAGYWNDVGVRVDLREVTSDEYRAQATSNNSDVTTWANDNISGPTISQSNYMMVPPFGNFFNPGNGFLWASWLTSDGADGIEPPEEVMHLIELSDDFLQHPLGSDESNDLGEQIVGIHVDNLWKIGTVGSVPVPVIQHNTLANFVPFTANTYDFYRSYPFRPQQWYFTE